MESCTLPAAVPGRLAADTRRRRAGAAAAARGQQRGGAHLFGGRQPSRNGTHTRFDLAPQGNKGGSLLTPDGGAPALRPLREFSNAVERTAWRAAVFTPDLEHVIGAAGAPSGAAASSSGMTLICQISNCSRPENGAPPPSRLIPNTLSARCWHIVRRRVPAPQAFVSHALVSPQNCSLKML